jgi:rhodanese-related sulfurtransferase
LAPSSARRAEALGYTNVKVFVGGMEEWKKEGYPVASTATYLRDLIAKDIPHVLVDVRPEAEAQKEHIKGAVTIPLDRLDKAEKLFPTHKRAPIIIYCSKDDLSQKAFDIIRKWGYINTSYLLGGLEAWKKGGGEVLSGQLKKEIVYIPKPKPGSIVAEDFKKMIAKIPADVIILDVREVDEVQKGAIPGTINIPVSELRERLKELPKDKEIIAHCVAGVRAEMAYNILREAGYKTKFVDATIKFENGKYTITEN